jgi:putative heme iron utilization protein
MFKWSKDGIDKGHTNQGYYNISSGQLSVSGHDGLWQCTPYNMIGNGASDTINVTVYGEY